MSVTNQLGIRNSNTIIPLTASTRRTKQLDLKAATTSNRGGWSCSFAEVIFYSDSDGNWRIRFNIGGIFTSSGFTGSTTVTFANLVFKNTADVNQSISGFYGAGSEYITVYAAQALGNSGTIELKVNGTVTSDRLSISGDVELNAEPTTYTTAANMEGVVAVDVFVPSAAAGIQGLVDNRVANTLGTPILGKTDGAAVAAGYVGETFKDTSSTFFTTSVSNIITRTLQTGKWYIRAISTYASGAGPTGITMSISTTSGSIDSGNIVYFGDTSTHAVTAITEEIVNISSATTFYIIGYSSGASVNNFQATRVYFTRIA